MPEERKNIKIPHNVIMENRSKLSISGIRDVDSFDEQTVILLMEDGELTVRGNGLHIGKFSVETGEIAVEGDIYALVYTKEMSAKGGVFSRLFK